MENNDFERVKTSIDIVRFIEHRAGKIATKVGNSETLKECPFCGGRDCFRIDKDKRMFKCFQCPKGGDVFSYFEAEGMTKAEALREAAKYAGIDICGRSSSEGNAKPAHLSTRQKVFRAAMEYYKTALWTDGRASYLTNERGRSQATLEAMKVGFSDGKLAETLLKAGFSKEALLKSGLVKEDDKGKKSRLYDLFSKGLYIYPHTLRGDVTHFTQKDPKKKKKHQLPVDYRDKHWSFYNQDTLSQYSEIIITEGENDVQAWMDAGKRNAVGIIGQISMEQIKALRNFSKGKHLYLCFDNDPAGEQYTRKVIAGLDDPEYHVHVMVYAGEEKGAPGDIDEHFKNLASRDCDQKGMRTEAKRLFENFFHPIAWEILQVKKLGSLGEKLLALKDHKVFEAVGDLVEVEKEVYIEKLVELGFTAKAIEEQIAAGETIRERVEEHLGGRPNKDTDPIRLATLIYKEFARKGRWLFDRHDRCFLFFKHRIYEIGSNRAFSALMKKHTGLLPTKEPGRSVWEALASDCYNKGRKIEVMSWHHTDRMTDSIFINLNSDKNTILRIHDKEIEEIENGTNKYEVLLDSSDRIMPFNYMPDASITEGFKLLKELVFDNLTCDVEQRYLILTWFMSCFLVDFSPYTALMKFGGSTKSGKTTAAKLLNLLIYGNPHLTDPTASAAYSVAAKNPLITIDNLESDDMTKMIMKFLLHSATKGSKEKRKGGTDTATIEESPRALVLITAIEPFAKSELINRTYDIDFSPRYKSDAFIEDEVTNDILKKRDLILSAILKFIARGVLPNLAKRKEHNIILKKVYRGHAKDRTNEFLAMLMLELDLLLKYIPFRNDGDELELLGDGSDVVIKAWIKYQNSKAKDTEIGTNPLITMLNQLFGEYKGKYDDRENAQASEISSDGFFVDLRHPDYSIKMVYQTDGEEKEGRYIEFCASSGELIRDFSMLCRNFGMKMPYRNPRQLGVRLANDEAALKSGGWIIIKGGPEQNHYNTIHGERRYKLRKRLKEGL